MLAGPIERNLNGARSGSSDALIIGAGAGVVACVGAGGWPSCVPTEAKKNGNAMTGNAARISR